MTASALAKRLLDAAVDWIVPEWPVPLRVQAFATTRNGGVSAGRHSTLNLGNACGDDPAAVAENRSRVQSFLPSTPVWLRQVHGNAVVKVASETLGAVRTSPAVADAAVTREPRVVLAVMVADCLPVLLADRSGRVIGVAHAGWRGLACGVLENVVAAMEAAPADIVAWLGPAIGQRAFEVGEDVVAAFGDADVSRYFEAARPGKWHADLYAIARARLDRDGVRVICGGGYCTFHDTARFFSHRRDRDTGRMAAFLWLAP